MLADAADEDARESRDSVRERDLRDLMGVQGTHKVDGSSSPVNRPGASQEEAQRPSTG